MKQLKKKKKKKKKKNEATFISLCLEEITSELIVMILILKM